jgi:hypothetical protein
MKSCGFGFGFLFINQLRDFSKHEPQNKSIKFRVNSFHGR